MRIELFDGLWCRKAEESDVSAMYNLLVDMVCDEEVGKSLYDVETRKLQMLIGFFVKAGDSLVVYDGDELVGAYIGENNKIVYIGSTGGVKGTIALFYMVLCEFHSKLKDSTFVVSNKKQRSVYEGIHTPNASISITDNGLGTIGVEVKRDIQICFEAFKGK